MNRNLSVLAIVLVMIPLSACAASPRQTPRQVEVSASCCCIAYQLCEEADEYRRCQWLNPDELDDFGPRAGQPRIIRCGQWENLNRFTDRCPQ